MTESPTQPINVIALDIEATGPDPDNDRIVQLTLAWRAEGNMQPGEERPVEHESWLVNPDIEIPAEATEIHGIRNEDVAWAPTFDQIAERVQEIIEGAILLGYNTRKYDTIILDNELRRVGQPGIDLDEVVELDPFRIWLEAEPRTLESAVKRYLGRRHQEGHTSVSDATVLFELATAQAEAHGMDEESPLELSELLELSSPPRFVDREGKFYRDEDGVIRLNFGKHKDQRADTRRGFLEWMLKPAQDFSPRARAVAQAILAGDGDLL